jgi:hypothetical protein
MGSEVGNPQVTKHDGRSRETLVTAQTDGRQREAREKCHTDDSARDRAVARILSAIHDGLRHGHFEYSLTCELIGHGRRRLLLHAGKKYQFVLTAESCIATEHPGDPQHADAVDSD